MKLDSANLHSNLGRRQLWYTVPLWYFGGISDFFAASNCCCFERIPYQRSLWI